MSKHTPGPWAVSSVGAGFEVEAARTYIAQALPTKPVRAATDHEERRANARLIAAAPEMLAALSAARDSLSCIPESAAGGDDDAVRLCRDADCVIAKATGGES